jgi:hypothetical protein
MLAKESWAQLKALDVWSETGHYPIFCFLSVYDKADVVIHGQNPNRLDSLLSSTLQVFQSGIEMFPH